MQEKTEDQINQINQELHSPESSAGSEAGEEELEEEIEEGHEEGILMKRDVASDSEEMGSE